MRPFLREALALLDMKGTEISATDVMAYFRWYGGLKYGKPVKKMFLPWPEGRIRLEQRIEIYSRRLYYHEWKKRVVGMLDLETRKRRLWPANDNTYFEFFASDRYLLISG